MLRHKSKRLTKITESILEFVDQRYQFGVHDGLCGSTLCQFSFINSKVVYARSFGTTVRSDERKAVAVSRRFKLKKLVRVATAHQTLNLALT